MARIRRLTGARAWAARISGLLVMAAIVALIVAVVPVLAGHDPADGPEVAAQPVDLGGERNDCQALADLDGTQFDHLATPPLEEFRVENPQDGITYTDPDTLAEFTLAVFGGGGKSFNWSTNHLVDAAIVKGGQKSVVYDYATGLGSGILHDDGLVGPLKKITGTQTFNVSHVSFCYTLSTSTVSGTVWHDHDQDGTQGTGATSTEPVEGGLAGWTINLYGTVEDTTTTGADGSYSFTSLPDGDYTICEVPAPLPTTPMVVGTWIQSQPTTTGGCSTGAELPDGHAITLAGNATADFGNYWTVTGSCDTTVYDAFGEHSITFPAVPLCDKPDVEFIFEAYTRGTGATAEQVIDFFPVAGPTGKFAHITEVLEFVLPNNAQNSTTLNYNDGNPNLPADDRVALYCDHNPLDANGDLIPGEVAGLLAPNHTTCIITSVENADGTRTDTLYSLIDGRTWM